jgi:4a-hydroxytetrahydrobiopterin dehydratase
MLPTCNEAKVLSSLEVEAALLEIPGWSLKDGKLFREFKFRNFSEAFAFMTRAALLSEQLNHHPEWSNVYNRVVVELTTHAAGGVTELDFKWAHAAGRFYCLGS